MPYLQQYNETLGRELLIGIYAGPQVAAEFPGDATLCGPNSRSYAEAAYNILASEINYAGRKES